MKHLFTLILSLLLFSSSFSQSIVYVTEHGSGNKSGSSWNNSLPGVELAHKTTQTPAGIQFWLAKGTYSQTISNTGQISSFSVASGVQLYGGFAGNETALSQRDTKLNQTIFSGYIAANPSVKAEILIDIRDASSTIHIDGITFQDTYMATHKDGGGGIRIEVSAGIHNVQVTNCQFINLQSFSSFTGGGGIIVLPRNGAHCNITIQHCYFARNLMGVGGAYTTNSQGGSSTSVIEDCIFDSNRAYSFGGAISTRFGSGMDALTIRRCQFVNHTPAPGYPSLRGGVLDLVSGNNTIEDCWFANNSVKAGIGGAIHVESNQPSFKNCVFLNNSANLGGAIYNTSEYASSKPSFINCNFIGNSASTAGGAFYAELEPTVPPVKNRNEITLTNCLVWQNTAPDGPIVKSRLYEGSEIAQLIVSYSTIQGGYRGTGNIDKDPLFVDSSTGDYQLRDSSPAINMGDPSSTTETVSLLDLAGKPRINQGRIDMGAYEHAPITFAITSVSLVTCQITDANHGEYFIQFLPKYLGQTSDPISFSVVNEMSTTTMAGPFTLRLYKDNPLIRLVAQQGVNTAQFTYDWQKACNVSPMPTTFGIYGITQEACQAITAQEHRVTFAPQYIGLTGEPVSFSVVNEMTPTLANGPFTLRVYTDNPVITLSAQQGSSVATYSYNWLALCNTPARLGASEENEGLQVKVLGNPIEGLSIEIEITGVAGKTVELRLVDQQGKQVGQQHIQQASQLERISLPMSNHPSLLLLQVNTSKEKKAIKLIKQ